MCDRLLNLSRCCFLHYTAHTYLPIGAGLLGLSRTICKNGSSHLVLHHSMGPANLLVRYTSNKFSALVLSISFASCKLSDNGWTIIAIHKHDCKLLNVSVTRQTVSLSPIQSNVSWSIFLYLLSHVFGQYCCSVYMLAK